MGVSVCLALMVDSFSSDPDMAVGELRPPYRYDVGTEFLAKRGQGEGCVLTRATRWSAAQMR
jgi:hypothetical protein